MRAIYTIGLIALLFTTGAQAGSGYWAVENGQLRELTHAERAAHVKKLDALNGHVRAISASARAKQRLTTRKQCQDYCYGRYPVGGLGDLANQCYYNWMRCPALP